MGVPKCCGQETCTENAYPAKNDRRCQLINEIKQMIGKIENEDKVKQRPSRRDGGVAGMRDLEEECRPYMKRRDCTPPLITAIALHETRPTSDYSNMQYESSSQVTYVDVSNEGREWKKVPPAPWDLPRTPSQELRGGTLYVNCDCRKRNGLQHDCPRWECGGRPECVAVNPGPCCIPSQAPKPERGDRRTSKPPQEQSETFGAQQSMSNTAKTPVNYDICIPKGSSAQQRLKGRPEGMAGFIGGMKVPEQGTLEIIEIIGLPAQSQGQQPRTPQAPYHQHVEKGVEYNEMRQGSPQTPHAHGHHHHNIAGVVEVVHMEPHSANGQGRQPCTPCRPRNIGAQMQQPSNPQAPFHQHIERGNEYNEMRQGPLQTPHAHDHHHHNVADLVEVIHVVPSSTNAQGGPHHHRIERGIECNEMRQGSPQTPYSHGQNQHNVAGLVEVIQVVPSSVNVQGHQHFTPYNPHNIGAQVQQPKNPQASYHQHTERGMEYNEMRQGSPQTPHVHGQHQHQRNVAGLVEVIQVGPASANAQGHATPQRPSSQNSAGITLTGSNMMCLCKPTQSAPTAGFGATGPPMMVVSSPIF